MKNYSLIVIGAGMSGLSTALAWTKTHDCSIDPVLVIEKEPAPGGCVTTFAREGYRFDTVQIIPDISDLLYFFQIEMELVPYSGHYARLFLADPAAENVTIFPIPSSRGDFEEMLSSRFPEEQRKIHKFFNYGQAMLDELSNLKTEPGPLEGMGILLKCPKIIRNSFRTFGDYLESYRFKSPELNEILDIFSSFSGLSGNRAAALLTSCAMMATLKGSYRPKTGFIQFPHLLRKKVIESGGEIRFSSRVDEIRYENGRVKGVILDDEIIYADNVVCTADTFETVEKLLGSGFWNNAARGEFGGGGKSWIRKYENVIPSPSSFTIHLGLDNAIDLKARGFDCGYNVLTTGKNAHERAFDLWEKDELLMEEEMFHMAVISPSAVIGGKATLIIHVAPAAASDWIKLRMNDYGTYRNRKERTAMYYIDKVEQYMIPELKKHIRLINIATPATYARYLGTRGGANSDMLSVPSNFGMFRLPTRTPVKGLYIPKFSHGIWPTLQAGLQVVDMITGGKIMNGNSSYSRPLS